MQECTLGTLSKNRIIFQNLRFDSSWEVSYYIFCKINNISIIRNQGEFSFPYIDNIGKSHKYYPDFYLPDINKFIEIKGDLFINEDGIILDFVTKKPNIEKTICVKEHAEILSEKELKLLGVKLLSKNKILEIQELMNNNVSNIKYNAI